MSKTFPGQRALSDVNLQVRRGEIHALVGENGSGKSTLIKCLAGYHQPDAGAEILVDGKPLPGHYPPAAARALGLAFMHQDLGLIPSLTVLENLALGSQFATTRMGRIRWRAVAQRAWELLELTGHDISPRALVGHLSRADQALVALARVFGNEGTKLAVFDEPTAALTSEEVPRMFDGIRALAARGAGVIYVSHRLGEVLDLSERITVLRDGRLVGTHSTASLDVKGLVREIVGDEMAATIHGQRAASQPPAQDARVVLQVEDLCGPGVSDVSFELRAGEILGVAGLLGSGRTELARLLFGAARATSGRITLMGRPLVLKHPTDAVRNGIALVPEDRLREATFPELTVRENATLLRARKFWRGFGFRTRAEAAEVSELMRDFGVRPPDPQRRLKLLSGGNQQKVVLGKWIRNTPKILILDEPMHGIDVGAKADVARIIRSAAGQNMSVVLIDSDFDNLIDLCHRVIVLSAGRQTALLAAEDINREHIVHAAYAHSNPERDRQVV